MTLPKALVLVALIAAGTVLIISGGSPWFGGILIVIALLEAS